MMWYVRLVCILLFILLFLLVVVKFLLGYVDTTVCYFMWNFMFMGHDYCNVLRRTIVPRQSCTPDAAPHRIPLIYYWEGTVSLNFFVVISLIKKSQFFGRLSLLFFRFRSVPLMLLWFIRPKV
jgi:hypothetical protein